MPKIEDDGKDHRYKYVRSIWAAGDLKSFQEIFSIIPRTIVANDLHLNYERFSKKVVKSELLTFKDIRKLSRLTGIDFKALCDLIVQEIERQESSN